LLEIKKLTCHYGVIKALHDVSISISDHGIHAVIGANGAGKSTLINAIAGLITPTSGSIKFNGEELTSIPTKDIVRHGISLCPEGRRIFKEITVYENLLAGAYTNRNKVKIEESIEQVYALFPRLYERQRQQAGTLSGGEQQMLAIGRALMADPKLLLLDEPSMGLAPNLIDIVFETIVRIYRERKIPSIVVEQNSEMALSIANRAFVLEIGEVVLSGTGQELLQSSEVKNKYLGA
jgi:branched-chain amino acid transport system ATP-binding protein